MMNALGNRTSTQRDGLSMAIPFFIVRWRGLCHSSQIGLSRWRKKMHELTVGQFGVKWTLD